MTSRGQDLRRFPGVGVTAAAFFIISICPSSSS